MLVCTPRICNRALRSCRCVTSFSIRPLTWSQGKLVDPKTGAVDPESVLSHTPTGPKPPPPSQGERAQKRARSDALPLALTLTSALTVSFRLVLTLRLVHLRSMSRAYRQSSQGQWRSLSCSTRLTLPRLILPSARSRSFLLPPSLCPSDLVLDKAWRRVSWRDTAQAAHPSRDLVSLGAASSQLERA